MMRTIVYVDGFNLYFGALKGSADKWLDLAMYFSIVRSNDDIQQIRYFTADVGGRAGVDQATYLTALATLPTVSIVKGKYKSKTLTCRVQHCAYSGDREFKGREEKQTDVNIAVSLVDDAFRGRTEQMIVISGDSDLLPAMRMVKQYNPSIKVMAYIPDRVAWTKQSRKSGTGKSKRPYASDLRDAADDVRLLPIIQLSHAQFAPTLQASDGSILSKPADW